MREYLRIKAGRARKIGASALVGKISASFPGFAGMALVATGAAFIYLPAGLIVAGLLCLRIDSRL